jgi:predicted metal-dependent hydrolase
MTKKIYIDGLEVLVTRKRIKRINLRVREPDGRISISAPYITPDREIIAFVRGRRNWIENAVSRVRAKSAAHPAPADRAEKEARRADLKRRVAERLPYIEDVTGLRCSGWTVRDMHTRWGSCNTRTHHINLSLMLATRSDAELDYVILHELVHTVVPNHGPDFYALMDRFMPGWKKIRKALNYG